MKFYNNNNNNNNTIPVIFPKCPYCDVYLNFFHGLVSSNPGENWYKCKKCNGLFIREIDEINEI